MSLTDLWWTGFTPPSIGYVGVGPKLTLSSVVTLSYPFANRPAINIPTSAGISLVAGDPLFTVFDTYSLTMRSDCFGGAAYIKWVGKVSEYNQVGWGIKAEPFVNLRDAGNTTTLFYQAGETYTGTLPGAGWSFDVMAGWGHLTLDLPVWTAGNTYTLWVGVSFMANGSINYSNSNTWTIQSTSTDVGVRYKTHGATAISGGSVKKVNEMVVKQGGVLKDVTAAYVVKSGALSPIIERSLW